MFVNPGKFLEVGSFAKKDDGYKESYNMFIKFYNNQFAFQVSKFAFPTSPPLASNIFIEDILRKKGAKRWQHFASQGENMV